MMMMMMMMMMMTMMMTSVVGIHAKIVSLSSSSLSSSYVFVLSKLLLKIFPPYAYGYGADSQSSSSSSSNNNLEVVKEVLVVLSRMFGISMSALQERLLDYIVTRWDDESYSRGSYSYLRPGGCMYVCIIIVLSMLSNI